MRDDLPVSGDLVGGTVGDWLVTGWFTEDETYRPLAQAFAASLTEHGAPFHLFAKPSGKGWSTRRKPSVVLEAMDAYPGKTIVLMDIDCVVHGSIVPVTQIGGDIGVVILARNMRKGSKWRHWIATEASSRILVCRPTEGARTFLRRWSEQIERSQVDHDEHAMIWSFLASPDVVFRYVPQEYSGREVGQLPGAIVEHASAHSRQKQRERSAVMEALRAFERRFLRSGRTAREKGTLPVMMKAG